MSNSTRKVVLDSGLTFAVRDDGPTIKEAETLLTWYDGCVEVASKGFTPTNILARLRDYLALGFVTGIELDDLDDMKAEDAADVSDAVSEWLKQHWPSINRMVNFVGKLPRPGELTDEPGPGKSESPESPVTAE